LSLQAIEISYDFDRIRGFCCGGMGCARQLLGRYQLRISFHIKWLRPVK